MQQLNCHFPTVNVAQTSNLTSFSATFAGSAPVSVFCGQPGVLFLGAHNLGPYQCFACCSRFTTNHVRLSFEVVFLFYRYRRWQSESTQHMQSSVEHTSCAPSSLHVYIHTYVRTYLHTRGRYKTHLMEFMRQPHGVSENKRTQITFTGKQKSA